VGGDRSGLSRLVLVGKVNVQRFSVTTGSGSSVEVEAGNWMIALGRAMPLLADDLGEMVQWVCTHHDDGSVGVFDPVRGSQVRVEPVVPRLQVIAAGRTFNEPEGPDRRPATEELPLADGPPPSLEMPTASRLAPLEPPPDLHRAPDDLSDEGFVTQEIPYDLESLAFTEEVPMLAERLFDLSMAMTGSSPAAASRMALDLLHDFLPSEASTVALASLNSTALVAVAATGPVKERLVGRRFPFGEGLLGLCFDLAIPVQVDDVRADDRHLGAVDAETGFQTRAVLCVPVQNEGEALGVLELINPSGGINQDDVDVVRQVAATLANALGGA
jgi:putative methionine-R-sulfoxide reductase with GAF domain